MFTPKLLQNLLSPFETSFSKPTFRTFQIVVLGAILTIGARTVCNIQRSLSVLAKAHPSTFHRFFSRRRWSLWSLGRILCSILLSSFCPTAVVPLVADDTVIRRKGKSVYGKGCHRDPTRSSHALTVRCWGHKWVVVALRVRLPWAARPWAIPLLAALYLAPKERERLGFVRAKSTNDLLRQLSIVLLRWFPDRQFTLAADGGYACHALSRFVARHSSRMTLVTKFYADANLYDLPTTRNRVGRPALKGESHPSPKEVVASTKRRHHATVPWYGGEERHISFVTDTSHWYKSGKGLVPIRWVHVKDHGGTHREEYFMCTNTKMQPEEIVATYTGRWSIETTFQDMRAYLGLETTREWCEVAVLRMVPCLLGLYSLIVLAFHQLPTGSQRAPVILWQGKKHVTFSDAVTILRRRLWSEILFGNARGARGSRISGKRLRALVLSQIAPAA